MLAIACALGACGADDPVVQPIIETPPETSAAYPYEGIDEIELSIARAGDDRDLVSATFRTGEPLVLREVPFGDDLVVHLRGLSNGSQLAYGRTCAISLQADTEVEPHLYFSRVVKWGPAPDLAQPSRGAGVLGYSFTEGRNAVFLGGSNPVIQSVERFSAITGQFASLSAMAQVRVGGMLAPLNDGRALLVGGVSGPNSPVETTELLDPLAAQGFQIEAQAGPGLRDARAIALVDGTVLVSGGDVFVNEAFELSGKGFLFSIGAGGTLDPPREISSTLAAPRRSHSVTRLSDELGADVLIAGGQDAAGTAIATAELYRPLAQAFETVEGAAMITPRWGHQAVRLPGGFVLVVGGMTHDPGGGDPLPVLELELYDPIQGRFSPAGDLPITAGITGFSLTRLPDGRYLMAGGTNNTGDTIATSFIIRRDPLSGFVDVSRTDDMSAPRAGHAAALLCDGTVLLAGGSMTASNTERYNPPETGRR